MEQKLEMNNKNKTVFVGVSGGVDSSVSLAVLKDQGYNVVGVFIKTWTPDFIKCTWREERRDAMRVCAHLNVPFLECDAEDAYKNGVADYMIEEYKKGKTPNPDVMCNREIKFGVFWNFAKKHGADYIATGHYAVCEQNNDSFYLKQSPDSSKDQSYFLWTLTQEDLSHILFPVGHLHKIKVRELALKYKLPTATKKDSQGVCFLGPLDMKDFLSHYIKPQQGDVLDENENVIGYHSGVTFFTLGERHGFVITDKLKRNEPYYIISKNISNNTITVSSNKKEVFSKSNSIYFLEKTNWINSLPLVNKKYKSQIRYHGEFINCKIECLEAEKSKITFDKDILVDSGQSVVFYDGDVCLGGGIVK